MKDELIYYCLQVDWFIFFCTPFRYTWVYGPGGISVLLQWCIVYINETFFQGRNVALRSYTKTTEVMLAERNPLLFVSLSMLMSSPWLTFLFSFLLSSCLLGRDFRPFPSKVSLNTFPLPYSRKPNTFTLKSWEMSSLLPHSKTLVSVSPGCLTFLSKPSISRILMLLKRSADLVGIYNW